MLQHFLNITLLFNAATFLIIMLKSGCLVLNAPYNVFITLYYKASLLNSTWDMRELIHPHLLVYLFL